MRKFACEIEQVKKEYYESVKKEMTNEWKYTMKYLIINKGCRANEFIQKSRVKMLKFLEFDVELVDKKLITYELVCTKQKFEVYYKGYLIDSEKEGYGI